MFVHKYTMMELIFYFPPPPWCFFLSLVPTCLILYSISPYTNTVVLVCMAQILPEFAIAANNIIILKQI